MTFLGISHKSAAAKRARADAFMGDPVFKATAPLSVKPQPTAVAAWGK